MCPYKIRFQNIERRGSATLLTKNDVADEMSKESIRDEDVKDKSEISPNNESFMQKIKRIFDLDLLKNSTYLNVSIGCSLFYAAETNFKLIIPFFLLNFGKF